MKKGKFDELLKKAAIIHNGKYDYSKSVEPKTSKEKIKIICPIHGEFMMSLDGHVNNRYECPKCSNVYQKTSDDIIKQSETVHGDKYTYDRLKYVNAKTKVCVTCPIHGDFFIRPDHLIHGVGCPKCAKNHRINFSDFVEKANKIHEGKYKYIEDGNFKNSSSVVQIVCRKHGIFTQKASSHLLGCGCPKCNGGVSYCLDDYIKLANEKHNFRYDYKKFVYKNANTKGTIICPIHGEFKQSMYCHAIKGQGCPKCKSSKLENIVIRSLDSEKIHYIYQFYLTELGKKSFDFFIPSSNVIIECQGEQHFFPTIFDKSEDLIKAKDVLKERKITDNEKYLAAKKNGYEILYFTIPNDFHTKDKIDFSTGFYSDKYVFTDIKELIKEIKKRNNESYKNGNFENLCDDIKKIATGIITYDNKIIKGDTIILYYYSENHEKMTNDMTYYKKRGFKNIIQIKDENYKDDKDEILLRVKEKIA